ncbi:hypothetical protein HZB89_01200, partial [archaeon]|nr:hypothetical protein [archaeon]
MLGKESELSLANCWTVLSNPRQAVKNTLAFGNYLTAGILVLLPLIVFGL